MLGVNRPEVRLPAPNTTPAPFMADLVDYHLRQVFAKLEIASEPSSPASNSTHQRARLLFNRKASFQRKNPAFAGLYIGAPGFEPGTSPTRIMGETTPRMGNPCKTRLL